MKISINYLLVIFTCGILGACGSQNQQDRVSDKESEISIEDTESVEDRPVCFVNKYNICNEGLAFAPLGSFISEIKLEDWEGGVFEDSLDYELGYVRLNRNIVFDEGMVLLEGEAYPEEEATDELLSVSKVSRIRVELGSFKTLDGVMVGMKLKKLAEIYKEEEMSILSFGSIPEFASESRYEFLILNPELYPNITYLVEDPDFALYKKLGEEIKLSQLPENLTISGIVISM